MSKPYDGTMDSSNVPKSQRKKSSCKHNSALGVTSFLKTTIWCDVSGHHCVCLDLCWDSLLFYLVILNDWL